MADALAFHPIASIFPLLEGDELTALVDDIRANGLHEAAWLYEGKILDGRNRATACLMAGVKLKTRQFEGTEKEAIDFALSANLHRRHLSTSQLILVGARARKFYDDEAKERQKLSEGRGQKGVENLPHLNQGKARDLAGKAVGVSGKSIDYGTKVLKQGTPELIAAVESDEISVSTAARFIAGKPAEEQRELVENTKSRKGARRMTASEPEEELPEGVSRGVGVMRANEAINCLMRIPKNDRLRKRGFQIVTDWIRHNP